LHNWRTFAWRLYAPPPYRSAARQQCRAVGRTTRQRARRILFVSAIFCSGGDSPPHAKARLAPYRAVSPYCKPRMGVDCRTVPSNDNTSYGPAHRLNGLKNWRRAIARYARGRALRQPLPRLPPTSLSTMGEHYACLFSIHLRTCPLYRLLTTYTYLRLLTSHHCLLTFLPSRLAPHAFQ